MGVPLLATKLRLPPQPHRAIQRTTLIDALEQGIPFHRLSLISAPAGYGKTTLLSQWAHASQFPIAWLSINEEDNDLDRFLRYLLMAWEVVWPGVRESSLGLLLSSISPDRDAVLYAFINTANDQAERLVFVLDDYHLIEDTAIHQALTFLLEHLPPTLHFVLSGRGEPSVPIARYRAHNEMLEMRMEDLAFTQDETVEFLNHLMGLNLLDDWAIGLHSQLEGWVSGLQLAAMAIQRHNDVDYRPDINGKNRYIADYLAHEVLAPLPEHLRMFLLNTSFLDRFCGTLCDAVLETDNSQEMLETLERENLFIATLDDSRGWFRYHRVFADFLYEELKRHHVDSIGDLHRRGAKWYLANDLPEQAFRHAMEAQDVMQVVQIFDRYLIAKIFSGELNIVKGWIDSIPAAWYAEYTELGLARAASLISTGALDVGARYLNEVEQQLVKTKSEKTHQQVAKVIAMRCFIACYQNDLAQAEAYASQALEDLPKEDLVFRADICQALGDTYRRNGDWKRARASYLKVFEFAEPAADVRPAHVFGALADLELQRGRLHDSAIYWGKALAAIQERENWGRLPLPVIGWAYVRMGEVLYEWNNLSEAWAFLSKGLERAEPGGDARSMLAGYLLGARLKLTLGDIQAAADYLEQARPLATAARFPDWVGRFERCQIEIWLAQDRLRLAVDWIDAIQSDDMADRGIGEIAALAIARVMIATGERTSIERGVTLLDGLIETAEAEGRAGVLIEGLALKALAYWKRDNQVDAMTTLEHALRRAEPEGFLRLLADLGPGMAHLLQEAYSRGVLPQYVEKLLATISVSPESPAIGLQLLADPLTAREQEILGLVAAGLTNREIAEKLVISPETVKKHTGTIYSKLGVSNRTEAAARARKLDLLD